ncbi:MAG: hypothetical protein GYB32_01740 [Algicola sp.]|nr:hypothetical protein [Algicola sp.]
MKRGLMMFMLVLTSALGCKDEPKVKNEPVSETAEVEKKGPFFTFNMYGTFENNDQISLYYLTPDSEKLTEKNALHQDIKGSKTAQNVNFELPEKILPTRLFIKLGNEGNQTIKFGSIDLGYGDHKINIPDSLFYQFFSPNKSINFNKENFTIETNKNGNQDPMFHSRSILENKIDMTFF